MRKNGPSSSPQNLNKNQPRATSSGPGFMSPKSQKKPSKKRALKDKSLRPPQSLNPKSTKDKDLKPPLDQWKKQYEDLNKKYQFLMAEYANYKKQSFKQLENFRKYEGQELIRQFIDKVMDNFDLAMQENLTEQNIEDFKKGLKMIHDNLKNFLKSFRVTSTTKIGEPFNPAFHNALDSTPTKDMPPDHILHIVKKAYFLQDKLIRPAEVVVSQKPLTPEGQQKP